MPWGTRLTLMIGLASLLFQLYVARKTIRAISAVSSWPKKYVRLIVGALLFLTLIHPIALLIGFLVGRNRSGYAGDSLLPYVFWIGLIIVVQLAVVFGGFDLVGLILRFAGKKPARSNRLAWLVIAAAVLMPAYVTAKVLNDTLRLRTTTTEFRVADLPADLDGLRIVQIADVQVDRYTNGSKLQTYIDTVNALQPDLILFCGDLVTSGTDYIQQAADAIGKMRSRLGVYGALGDHDFFSNREQVIADLKRNGVTILDDESVLIRSGNAGIGITGVTNVYRRRAVDHSIETLEQKRTPGDLNVFVTHQPSESLVKSGSEHGYDLFLAGHTHGGQIVFPLPGFPLSGSRLETPYVTGFYRAGSMLISTTNGLGMTLAPIRYHAPAEVTLIVVRR